MCSPAAPPAPDFTAAANAQGQANVDAARVQGQLNNPNVNGPYGSQTVSFGPSSPLTAQQAQFQSAGFEPLGNGLLRYGSQTFPVEQIAAGFGWDVPSLTSYANRTSDQPNITQTLAPEQQAILDASSKAKLGLSNLAGQGATALQGVVGTPVDFSGAPQTGSYDATRKSVIDAMMGRANEDYAKQTDNSNSNLIAAGIRPGTTAYANQQQMIERARTDARNQAEVAGGNAAAQAYGIDEARRRQAITEQLAQRQTPLNEISALMSGSQVTNPFAMPGYAQNAQVQPAPLFGATQATGDWNAGLYNSQAAQAANLQSGLFGLGGAALKGAGAAYGG